jgi:predicted nucleic-acid-binding Zn-ribbon protein
MSQSSKPESYEVQGRPLKCQLCNHHEFLRREGQLNTRAASFFNLDWANTSAICFVCDNCGYIHWFLPK